ncbi:phosphoadenosine phosphosulfate reductase [Linnemannia elongata]|uniref:Phosphoadenosine phosphosulfate reductase n=1 Tax=Linnemannia elongata AG-77 TaxID=1314771 RepID=A0A197K6N0_9FUNG|nr:phosphoadenosine phosphosulfate reductase [Linnemannia elongata]KAK5799654.1 phosphoadenosine phosphosulfate reductase [Linnemannia elongata]OAQ32366.1 phosphoadenosine phosphosulfate reductase [Linnemannia elongata AG-77]
MPESTAPQVSSFSATFTPAHLKFINAKLEKLSPEKIIEWAMISLPGLIQTTAFGPTGLVILDMINRIHIDNQSAANSGYNTRRHPVPLIFIDTLYHFQETLDLAQRVQDHYNIPLKVYKPLNCETTADFESQYGQQLWETDDLSYDYLVKVEPGRRAYQELGAQAVISGRRRSQKGDRAHLDILEIESGTGLLKLNPLATWSFQQVWTYLRAYQVPFNALLDQGYRSIGDWHSTKPASNPDDERSGRWEGKQKSECGLHVDYFKMRAEFQATQKKKQALLASREAAAAAAVAPAVQA